jgi:hypothetical protein
MKKKSYNNIHIIIKKKKLKIKKKTNIVKKHEK